MVKRTKTLHVGKILKIPASFQCPLVTPKQLWKLREVLS